MRKHVIDRNQLLHAATVISPEASVYESAEVNDVVTGPGVRFPYRHRNDVFAFLQTLHHIVGPYLGVRLALRYRREHANGSTYIFWSSDYATLAPERPAA